MTLSFIVLSALPVPHADASSLVRSFTPRFSVTARGDLLIIGNVILTCPDASAICAAARNGAAPVTADNNNNAHDMVWINQDGVTLSPENSSRATLTIPGGSTVLFAGLYWGADTSAGTNGTAAPTPANRNQVRFATPASGYAATTAAQVDVSGTRYSAFADVTSRVQAGGSGVYRVSGMQAGRGQDRYAGWTLVVVLGNASLPPRNMVVFDGYATVNSTAPSSIVTSVAGFRTPPSGAVNSRVGFIAYEGDLGSTGDNFRLNTTNLSDALNPAANAFNSTVTAEGVRFAAKEPDYINQFGYDADLLTANGILANNATSASVTFTTGGETYFPAAILFSTVVFEPVLASNLVKSVSDVNGGAVAPGDVLEYTVTYGNTGNDGATNVVLTDVIPVNTTYVPNSLNIVAGPNAGIKTDAADGDQANLDVGNNRVVFRLGTGADGTAGGTLAPGVNGSLRFRVQISAAAAEGTIVPNTAQIAFRSQSLDEPRTADSNTVSVAVSNRADLSIAKTDNVTTVTAGQPTTYVITVSNAGPAAANGAVVRDPAAALLDCLNPPATGSATCEGTGGALCPGGAASGTIPVATLQASGGAVIPMFPAGGQIRLELVCVPLAN